jgi:hypothetical protein
MGSGEDAREAESKPARGGLLTVQIVLGAASLALLGWLVEVRDGTPIQPSATVASDGSKTGMRALAGGLQGTLEEATRALDNGERGRASHAIDAAHRVASIGDAAAPGTAFASVLQSLEKARHAMHIGRFELALTRLETARGTASTIGAEGPPPSATERPSLDAYGQATVVNGNGVMIGEVVGVEGDELRLALGGARDVLGFWDIGRVQEERVPRDAVVLGPSRSLGHTLVALPSAVSTPPVSMAAAER